MHSTPKLKFKLKDVEKFLRDNFPNAFNDMKQQKDIRLDISGKQILLMQDEDDASFIECTSAIGDTSTLLQFLFYCIIDTSEVPEFAFGVHISSSQASTKEQGPILTRRIERKREQVETSWKMFARMALSMISSISGRNYKSYNVEIEWDVVMDKDEQSDAQTLYVITQALSNALDSNIIRNQSAVEYLAKYIDTMETWEQEQSRIEDTKMLNKPIEEAYQQNKQLKNIDDILTGGNEV